MLVAFTIQMSTISSRSIYLLRLIPLVVAIMVDEEIRGSAINGGRLPPWPAIIINVIINLKFRFDFLWTWLRCSLLKLMTPLVLTKMPMVWNSGSVWDNWGAARSRLALPWVKVVSLVLLLLLPLLLHPRKNSSTSTSTIFTATTTSTTTTESRHPSITHV